MANTLATKKQSAAIRERMQAIRTELPYDVDEARQRVKELSDWKYHVSRRPGVVIGLTFAVGYLVIPHKRSPKAVVVNRTQPAQPAKKGMVGGVVAAAGTMLMRQGLSLAASQANKVFAAKMGQAKGHKS